MWEPQPQATLRASRALTGITLPLSSVFWGRRGGKVLLAEYTKLFSFTAIKYKETNSVINFKRKWFEQCRRE
jgi:hypothetical protein